MPEASAWAGCPQRPGSSTPSWWWASDRQNPRPQRQKCSPARPCLLPDMGGGSWYWLYSVFGLEYLYLVHGESTTAWRTGCPFRPGRCGVLYQQLCGRLRPLLTMPSHLRMRAPPMSGIHCWRLRLVHRRTALTISGIRSLHQIRRLSSQTKRGLGPRRSRTKDVFSSALAVYGPFLEGTAFGASEAAAWRC